MGRSHQHIAGIDLQHGTVPIQATGQGKFGETRAAVIGPPVGQGGDALPAILASKGGEIQPIS